MSKSVIRWNDEERELVLRNVAEHMVTDGFERGEFMKLLRAAQLKLPANRRRNLETTAFDTAGRRHMEDRAKRFRKELIAAASKVAHAPAAPVMPMLEEEVEDGVSTLLYRLGEEIGGILGKAILESMEDTFMTIEQRLANIGKPTAGQLKVENRMPRVLVVGTFPLQQNEIEKEFQGLLDIRFWDNKRGSAGLDTQIRKAEFVLMNGAACRHSHLHVIQTVARSMNIPWEIINGGVSTIKDHLEKFYIQYYDKSKKPVSFTS